MKFLSGSATNVQVKTNSDGKQGGGKYAVYMDINVFGVPGSRRLKNVRFFGPLNFKAKNESRQSPPGFYDGLIEWATSNGESLERVLAEMRSQLDGVAVTAQNVGGRWLIR